MLDILGELSGSCRGGGGGVWKACLVSRVGSLVGEFASHALLLFFLYSFLGYRLFNRVHATL